MFIDKTHYPNRKSVYSSSSTQRDNLFRRAKKSGGVLTHLRLLYRRIISPQVRPPRQLRTIILTPVCKIATQPPSTRHNHSNGRRRNVMPYSALDAPGRQTNDSAPPPTVRASCPVHSRRSSSSVSGLCCEISCEPPALRTLLGGGFRAAALYPTRPLAIWHAP